MKHEGGGVRRRQVALLEQNNDLDAEAFRQVYVELISSGDAHGRYVVEIKGKL